MDKLVDQINNTHMVLNKSNQRTGIKTPVDLLSRDDLSSEAKGLILTLFTVFEKPSKVIEIILSKNPSVYINQILKFIHTNDKTSIYPALKELQNTIYEEATNAKPNR